jgi:6-phosphogluconolactonase (cycloisomerase 2 family)
MTRSLSILFVFILFHSAILGKAFTVYSPSSKENTLWIVKATPKGRKFEARGCREGKIRLLGPCNYRSSQQTPSLCQCYRWRSREGTGSGRVPLKKDGSYQKHQNINFNDGACYLSLDKENRHILGVSYGNGRLNVYSLDDQGIPGKAVTTIDEGKKEAHCVLLPPDGKNVYIPYVKGNLAILQYAYDGNTGKVTPLKPKEAKPPLGSGPRHMAYHPTLPMVYFSNEQGIGLSSYRREANGQLKVEQDISILPPGMSKIGLSASDLLITPDGKFLFAGLRGHRQDFDRISRYRVLEDGKAKFLGLTEADQVPWGLTLSPDGNFLLVSATTGASLAAYRISEDGNLKRVATLAWDERMSDLVAR